MNLVLYLNCHGKEIKNYFLNFTEIKNIHHITTYEYINEKKLFHMI